MPRYGFENLHPDDIHHAWMVSIDGLENFHWTYESLGAQSLTHDHDTHLPVRDLTELIMGVPAPVDARANWSDTAEFGGSRHHD